MKFSAKMDIMESIRATLSPHYVIRRGAFGTNKKTVPLYSGPQGDPNRRIIGEVEIDLDTGEMKGTIESPEKMAALDAQIDRLHGPGVAAALDAAIADGSIYNERP